MLKLITSNALDTAFPNILFTLRIYLSLIAVTVVGNVLFSTLKRVKNELRSTMGQNLLNALSLLCIENELLQEIDVESTI